MVILFLAWRKVSRRSRDLATLLNAKLVCIHDAPPYLRAWFRTKSLLREEKPDIIIAQLPQGPLLLRLATLKNNTSFVLVSDVHTGFLIYSSFKEVLLNRPFVKYLSKSDLILVHNECIRDHVIKKLSIDPKKVLVVYDPIPEIPERIEKPPLSLEKEKFFVFPASWHPDEPIEYIVNEFIKSKIIREAKLVITGNPSRRLKKIEKIVRKHVDRIILTGYLPERQYYWLLLNAEAIIAATTRECTMLSAIWEAVAAKKPVLVSRTRTLYSVCKSRVIYFDVSIPGSLRTLLDCWEDVKARFNVSEFCKHLHMLSTKSITRLTTALKKFLDSREGCTML